jgi:hypothetical protein
VRRQRRQEAFERLGEVPAHPPSDPLGVDGPGDRDGPEDDRADPLRVGHPVRQGQGRAPRSPEQDPTLDAQVGPQPLEVGDEMGRSVDRQVGGGVLCRRSAPAGAPLVEEHDAVPAGVEEPRPPGRAARPRTAVEDHGRLPGRVAADLIVEALPVPNLEPALVVGRRGVVHESEGMREGDAERPASAALSVFKAAEAGLSTHGVGGRTERARPPCGRARPGGASQTRGVT